MFIYLLLLLAFMLNKTKARILIYLSQAKIQLRWLRQISTKLGIEYHDCSRVLNGMKEERLLLRSRDGNNKVFWTLSSRGKELLPKAKELI